jgi:chromosome segregation ATPase
MRLFPARYVLFLLPIWLLVSVVADAQTPPPAPLTEQIGSPLQGWDGPISPEMIAARKQAVQARLKALDQSALAQDDFEATQAALQQQLNLLSILDDLLRQQHAYGQQLQELPQRLADLNAERKALDEGLPESFPEVSEQLRDRYETQLQATRTEIETLSKQHAATELRLAGITKEWEQLGTERGQIEQALLAERSEAAQDAQQSPLLLARFELLQLKLQLARVKGDTLEAERQWLTQQRPVQDAMLSVAKARLRILQQSLDTIKQALGRAIRQEQVALTTTARGIERKLEKTADPTEALLLAVRLETVEIRKDTAQYRQQLNRIGDRVLGQEKFNSQEKQDLDRLVSLVERYAGGERVAQRLQLAFARLRRERVRFRGEQIRELDGQLQKLTEQALDLDERLYEFDRVAELRIGEMRVRLGIVSRPEHDAKVAQAYQALEEKKQALREQQQALALLMQELNKTTVTASFLLKCLASAIVN